MADTNLPQRADAKPRPGLVLAERYELHRLIASGGMAEVWEGVDQVLERPVAIKVLHAHLAADESFTTRFRSEALAAARLRHPSIVAIYDTCQAGDLLAIVMELVRGRNLREYLDERGRLDPVEVVHIGADVADALTTAHRAGVIHRDIKPANILLCDDGRVMVTDFGIAKVHDSTDMTNTGTMLGTVKYLAPEQVEGEKVDGRTDIYGLGVVLYEALCGRPPFVAEGAAATALVRLHQDPPRPSTFRADIPPALEQALLIALARSRDVRFTNAASMRQALTDPRVLAPATPRQHVATSTPVEDPTTLAAPPTATEPTPDRSSTAAPSGATPWPRAGREAPGHVPGTAPVPTPTAAPAHARPRRHWLVPAIVAVVVLAASGLAALLIARSQAGDVNLGGAASGVDDPSSSSTVALTATGVIDPAGDGEHDDEVGYATDGDPRTSWRTETYRERDFGGAKDGVGLILTTDDRVELDHLSVVSESRGWSAQIYVADQASDDRRDWGDPVTSATDIGGDVRFALGGAKGSAVLIWITELGTQPNRVAINEVTASR